MFGDDVGERVVSMGFRFAGNLTNAALRKIFQGTLSTLEKGKTKLLDEGKQSISHLSQGGNQMQGIEVGKNEIAGFDQYAKRYRINFSLIRQKNDHSQYALFFPAKDISKMELAMRDFVNDKTLDNNTLTDKMEAAREKSLSINQARQRERETKQHGKQKKQRSEPQL